MGPLQRLFNDAQAIVEHARELSSASTGFVSVAALPTVCAGVLPNLVGSFIGSFPGVRIQIVDVVAERIREAVLKRQVDFGIGTNAVPDPLALRPESTSRRSRFRSLRNSPAVW
jgi:LysR family carnitine catabolism transcriptional activator